MAVITNPLKKQVIQSLLTDFSDSAGVSNYYIGIGRSEDWNDSDTARTVINAQWEERGFRNGLQSVKKIVDSTFVVPRYNWSSGAVYSAYDDKQVGYPAQTYYVMNDENQVYICLQQSKDTSGNAVVSTIQPSGNTTGAAFSTADGYIWKFLYSISAGDATKYIAANFLPIKFQGSTDSSSSASDVEQLSVQNAAVAGQITGYVVDSGGLGYTSNPTLAIVGDGTNAKASATISGSGVVKVEVLDSSGTLMFGSGYNNATVTVSGGGTPTKPASIRPVFATSGGLGADPRSDLRANGIMFTVKPDGTENDDFIVGNDFRQVGLVKNIKDSAGSDLFTASTGIALKKLVFSAVTTGFTADNTIVGSTSGAKALIDKVDSSNVWYHQTDVTGFSNFDSGEAVTEADGSGAGTLNASFAPYVTPEVTTSTGDVLYIDNRAAVTRASDQTEDIKIVIQI
jgi:hypothetical protein